MAGQSLNATFFALRKREKSGVLTSATIAYLVVAFALLVAFIALNYQAVGAMAGWYGQLISSAASGAPPSPAQTALPAGVGVFFLTLIPFLFATYLLFAAYEAACLRWLVRGETGGFMGLSLNPDTWRVYLTYWVWFGLYMAFSMVFTILTAAAAGIGVMTASAEPGLTAVGSVLLVTVLRLVLMIFFAVRLAPAAATSVGMGKFAFFTAWTVTKGRFWAMFGAFLLVFLLIFVAEIVILGVAFGVVGFGAFQSGASDPSQFMATLFTPQSLVIVGLAYVLLLVLIALIYLLLFGINARAVIAAAEDGKIEGVNAASLAKTFD